MINKIRLGKAEKFILEYLYEKELLKIPYTTHNELLDKYNKRYESKVKSIKTTLNKLYKKEWIDREIINRSYEYWISYKGIIIIEKNKE